MSEFDYIIKDIVSNPKFQSLKKEPHHGITRYDHIMHVAKRSYKMSKRMKMDYVSATRGALLHDYYNDSEYNNLKGSFKKASVHPSIALANAKKDFILNKKEENIIISHMYPFGKVRPNCKESWLVSNIDTASAIVECSAHKWREKLTIAFLFLVNILHM